MKTPYPGTAREIGAGSVICLEITDTLGKTCIIKYIIIMLERMYHCTVLDVSELMV